MQISISVLNAINKQITKVFNDTIKMELWYQKVVSKRVVANSTFTEKWWHAVPEIQEYNTVGQPGKPVVNTFGGSSSYRLKDYAEILSMSKQDIEDDELGQYLDVLKSMTESLVRLPQKMLELTLNNGEAIVSADGAFLFANVHDPGNGVVADFYDNLFAGSGTTLAQIESDLDVVRIAMNDYKAANGVKRGLIANMAIVPMQLDLNFKRILNNTWNPNDNKSTENVMKGLLKDGVQIGNYLDDINDWYITASNDPTQKSLGWRVKRGYDGAKLTSKIDPKDDNVFYQDEFHWGIETHALMMVGWPSYIAKIVN